MKYDFELDLSNRNSLSILLSRVKRESKILEFGPANGRMTKYMKEQLNCKIYAVEIDEKAAKDAEKYTEKIIVDSIENYTWQEDFKGIKFDYIIFADVLEHLYNPEKVLNISKNFLNEDGTILISVPNISHNAIIMELLQDKFTYRNIGLLDDSHIRFFTKTTLEELIKKCNLEISYETGTYANPSITEFGYKYEQFDSSLGKILINREYGEIYQFIFEIKLKSIGETLEDFNKYETATLYFDEGEGFKEDKKFLFDFSYKTDKSLNLDLKNTLKNITAIRIDIFEIPFKIKIKSLRINNIEFCEEFIHNGIKIDKNEFQFFHEDPQIIINFQKSINIDNFYLEWEFLEKFDDLNYLKIEEKNKEIEEKNKEIEDKNKKIELKNKEIAVKNKEIGEKNREISELENLAQSLRIKNRIKSFIKRFIPQKIWKILRYMKNNPSAIKLGLYILKTQGIKAFLKRVSKIDSLTECRIINSYKYNEPKFNDDIEQELKEFNKKPLISIIMPVYNVDPKWLELAIKSVEKQWYENWELCITDDKSTNSKTIEYLKSIKNPKIKIKFLERNLNISGASNEALTLASGEYIALMDNDDEITPDALYEVLRVINNTDSEFIYSDEDKMNMEGNCLNPYFKPDYSYDLLLSLNYICHFSVIKKSIIDEIKGFNTQYNGAQDYDLFLRVIEKTNKIYHIPKVLYHWRMIETSTAMSSATKPYAHDAGKKAVQSHFDRMGIRAKVIDSEYIFVLDVDYEMPNINPLVSIIMPTKDAVNYLETCINSIVNLSTYKNYEILILNNNSEKEETFEWFKKVQQKYSFVKVIEANYEFNWSKLNNHGIKEAKGDVYIFLNNDIEIITPNWIERLASKALQPNVGAVGALLLFEDDTIQHAGVVVGLNGWADHLYRTAQPVHLYINYTSPMVNKNVLAVTGACVAISKKTIENIGNFSEDFLICGSDVEICLRAYEKGYRNILDANTKLYHFESKTRSSYVPECDFEMSRKAYKYYWENGDPFYNKNLSLNGNLPNIRN